VSVGRSQKQDTPPPNKSMFDFVSPFDARFVLGSPHSHPCSLSSVLSCSSHSETLGHPEVIDPKYKSVDNLLEELGNSKAPVPPPSHPVFF
jgi:hypothetical protein